MLSGIVTAVVFFSFISICIWVIFTKKKQDFDEAANLPFADDQLHQKTLGHEKDRTPFSSNHQKD